jgi:hypothetical protein
VISRRFGERRIAEMPDDFFDGDGELSDAVTLEFVRPPILPALSDAELQARLRDAVAKLVKRAREDMALRGLLSWGATPCSAKRSARHRKRPPRQEIRALAFPPNRRPCA